MQLTDTHTHLFADEFDTDRPDIIRRALENKVTKCFLPNIDCSGIGAMLKVCDEYPETCLPMIGLHPCSVDLNYERQLEEIHGWFGKRKFWGVGETGIDLFHDVTYAELQKKAFRVQVQWAKDMSLPIIIHCRNSFNEVMEIVEQMYDESLKGIFHCFTGSQEEAKRVMELNTFKMGIGGVVTYKNSALPQVLKEVPLPYLVLETDSPYLPPVPYRGKRNESSYIKWVAEKLAEIYQLPLEEVANRTTENARIIFGDF
jgi:TatD DNase family protein